MYKIFILSFLLLCINISFATTQDDLIAKGNQFYQSGYYRERGFLYQQVTDAGYESPVLYYNLGNSNYRQGKIGYAILNYERAQKLAPGDEDITQNFALANYRIVDKIDNIPPFFLFKWWESLLAFFTISGWTYIAYLFYILVLLSIALFFFTKSPFRQKLSLYSAAGFILLLKIPSPFLPFRIKGKFIKKKGFEKKKAVTAKLSPDD